MNRHSHKPLLSEFYFSRRGSATKEEPFTVFTVLLRTLTAVSSAVYNKSD